MLCRNIKIFTLPQHERANDPNTLQYTSNDDKLRKRISLQDGTRQFIIAFECLNSSN